MEVPKNNTANNDRSDSSLQNGTQLNEKWEAYIKANGADFVRFVDITPLPVETRGEYTRAVFFCKVLSRGYLSAVRDGRKPERQEFGKTEHAMDALCVKLANELTSEGYDSVTKITSAKIKSARLPHKTIARMAGFGFIGKNTLLVSEEFGCAAVLGKVLTVAPFAATQTQPIEQQCGDCSVCVDICPAKALLGAPWSPATTRDEMLVRKLCSPCMKCMIHCPYTVHYIQHG